MVQIIPCFYFHDISPSFRECLKYWFLNTGLQNAQLIKPWVLLTQLELNLLIRPEEIMALLLTASSIMKLEMAVNKSEEWRLCCRYTKGKEISNKQLNKEEVRSSKQGSKTIFLDATGTDFERLNTHDSSGREGIQIQRQDRTGSTQKLLATPTPTPTLWKLWWVLSSSSSSSLSRQLIEMKWIDFCGKHFLITTRSSIDWYSLSSSTTLLLFLEYYVLYKYIVCTLLQLYMLHAPTS